MATKSNMPETNKDANKTNGNFSQGENQGASKTKKRTTLKSLFETELKDAYSAEKQLMEALPEMARAAYSDDLQEAILDHLEQTKRHVERIEKVFIRMRIEAEENTCEAMQGLIKEVREVISEFEESPVRDAALIIGAQKIEHYEIATYGSLCELADVLGMQRIKDTLGRILDEEEEADELLSQIAIEVNDEAFEMETENQYN